MFVAHSIAMMREESWKVRLPTFAHTTELGVFLAALAISTLIPVAMFVLFQRQFLNSAGLGGAVKG